MPLDPDEIRTPPTLPAEPAPAVVDVTPPPAESGPPKRLIDLVDDRSAESPIRRSIPEGPAPHPFFAPLGAPIDTGALEPDAATRGAWMQEVADHVLELLNTIPDRP